jgi:hypothetical protein
MMPKKQKNELLFKRISIEQMSRRATAEAKEKHAEAAKELTINDLDELAKEFARLVDKPKHTKADINRCATIMCLMVAYGDEYDQRLGEIQSVIRCITAAGF